MSGDAPPDTAGIIDLFASEYGWQAEYILGLPPDVANELVHAILYRRGAQPVRAGGSLPAVRLADRITGIIDAVEKVEPWRED